MSHIEFNDEQYSQPRFTQPQPSGMAARLIKVGLAKDKRSANIILLSVIVLLMIIFLFSISSNADTGPENAIDTSVIDPNTNLPYGVVNPE